MPIALVTTPENRSAWIAFQDLLEGMTTDPPVIPANPLFLLGPTGSGKTHLLRSFTEELTKHDISPCVMTANDFATEQSEQQDGDLLIIEDLQHLPTRYTEKLVQIIDERLRQRSPMIFTARYGPGELNHRGTAFPQRLTTRLAAGLVVSVQPMQASSRRKLLEALCKEEKIKIAAEILDWLAEHLGGGRQLEGAIRQLTMLQRLSKKPLQLAEVRDHFRVQMDADTPTVQRIAERVGDFFRVEARRLRSEKRSHDVLLPRQVSMYLARQLTNLSLKQIGMYFGGRDHKTVQHACKKVAQAMQTDQQLSGAVREMLAACGFALADTFSEREAASGERRGKTC